MKIGMNIMYAVRGLLAIFCGVTVLTLPSPTIYSLAIIFSAYCVLEGLVILPAGLKSVARKDPRWYLIGQSAANLGAGLLILLFVGVVGFVSPRTASVLLLLLLSGRIIVIGLIELLLGIFRRKAGAPLRAPVGLASIVFGLAMIYLRDRGILYFVLPLGIFGIGVGIFLIFICFTLRDMDKTTGSPET